MAILLPNQQNKKGNLNLTFLDTNKTQNFPYSGAREKGELDAVL